MNTVEDNICSMQRLHKAFSKIGQRVSSGKVIIRKVSGEKYDHFLEIERVGVGEQPRLVVLERTKDGAYHYFYLIHIAPYDTVTSIREGVLQRCTA